MSAHTGCSLPEDSRGKSETLAQIWSGARGPVERLSALAVLPLVPPEDPLFLLLIFQPYGLICITGVSLAAAEALRGSCFNVPALSGPAPSFPSQRGQGS